MKRLLIPVLTASLLVGCDGDDPHAALAGQTDGSAAAPKSPAASSPGTSNSTAPASESVRPPAPPPALPEAVRDVVKLAQTSVSEGVLVDYINTLKEPYSLGADQIIYLTDLGIPGPAIQALLKHSTGPNESHADATPVATTPPPAPADTNTPVATPTQPAVSGLAGPGAPPPPPASGTIVAAATVIQAPATTVTVNTFYDSLSGYGSWVEVPEYGWCWQPSVASVDPNWQPYADNGGWLWTDSGWYWNSYYSWGWAPFHYGRWHRAHFGWCWVPDTCWAPAWVAWRSMDSHCGWAPLPPGARWGVSVGLTWHGHLAPADCDFGLFSDSFVYIGWNRFCDPHPWHHYLPRRDVPPLHALSHPVNQFHEGPRPGGPGHGGVPGVINNGPGLGPVQAHSSTRIPRVQLNSVANVPATGAVIGLASRPGQPVPTLPVYRPQIAAAPAPAPGGGRAGPGAAVPSPRQPQSPTPSQFADTGIRSPVTPPPARQLASFNSERAASIPTQIPVVPRPPIATQPTRMPSTLPATPVPGRSFLGGSLAPLPAFNSGPGAGPNHVLTGADTVAAPATPRTPAGPTIVTRPTAQRTLVGPPSGAGSVATPGSPPQLPVRTQGQGPAEGSMTGASPVPRRVNSPASLYQGSATAAAEQPSGPTVVRPGGGSYTQTAPTPAAGRVVYGAGREYAPAASVATSGPAYPGGGGGAGSYSGSSTSAASTGNSYSAPTATARNFSAPASSTPTFTPATRSYSAPANPSFSPPTRSYSAPAPSAPASSGGGSSGTHSGGGGSNSGGNKKNP